MSVPVVLVHGARVSSTMWRAQVAALERAGRPVLAVDLPGHGTRRSETFTVAESLGTLERAVDHLGGRAAVVGVSLGGYLGIAHAARRPDQVAGLVAASCCTVPGGPAHRAWIAAARLIGRLPDEGERLNATLVRWMLPPQGARDVGEGGYALGVMVDLLTAMATVRPLEDLAATRCPVWLVNGRWDHFRLDERAFLAACPDGRLVVVPRATHLVSVVRPLAFTRVVLEALDEVDEREVVLDGRGAAGQRGAEPRSVQARTPPTIPAELGTTTTSSPRASSTAGRMRREFPPPR